MKKIAILQSNYIPWKGYFDMIASVDEFIFYDEMQYTKNDWRNRNKIKTSQGAQWLSIPVLIKGNLSQAVRILDAKISDRSWPKKHWNTIKQNYSKATHFKQYAPIFEELYLNCADEEHLCQVNYQFIKVINEILGIKTKITHSTDYKLIEGKTERLVDLIQQAGGTEYLSGPAAKDYIDESCFTEAGIQLSWMDYSNYPTYPQLYGDFEHAVSVLDLIFNCGDEASLYMKKGQ